MSWSVWLTLKNILFHTGSHWKWFTEKYIFEKMRQLKWIYDLEYYFSE